MNIKLLIAEHEDVVQVVLDFVKELKADGFGHDVKPIVVRNITEAYIMIGECDMAIIDIGEKERENLAIATLVKYNIPTIVTSALFKHQGIEDRKGFGFLSKPKFDLKKLRGMFEEFAELMANSNGEKAFAI